VLSKLQDFTIGLEEYDQTVKAKRKHELNYLLEHLPGVAERIRDIEEARLARLKAKREDFNLFTVLLKINDETRLHSRFIAHLLDPAANHYCENLFLNLFLDTVSAGPGIGKLDPIKSAQRVEARTEKPTDKGRSIDIYLEFSGFKIAIENKIWAGEQENQIADYAVFIDSNTENNFLFYLTLNGDESKTANKETVYFRISYREHILKWIELCINETTKYPNINHALIQYNTIIKKLTNQTMEDENINEIKEMIIKHPVIIDHINTIDNVVMQIKEDSISSYYLGTKAALESSGSYSFKEIKGDPIKILSKPETIYESDKTHPPSAFGFWRGGSNDPESIYVGLLKDGVKRAQLLEDKVAILSQMVKLKYQIRIHEDWVFYVMVCEGFWSSEFVADMRDETRRKAKIDTAVKEISEFVKYVNSEWAKINQ